MMNYGRYGWGGMHSWGDFAGGWMMLMMFGGILITGLLIYIFFRAFERSNANSSNQHDPSQRTSVQSEVHSSEEAIRIAKRRLASGEITTEQYQEIIRHL